MSTPYVSVSTHVDDTDAGAIKVCKLTQKTFWIGFGSVCTVYLGLGAMLSLQKLINHIMEPDVGFEEKEG